MFPVVPHQPMFTDALSWLPWTESLESAFTITTKFGDVVRLASVRGSLGQKIIGVPRNSAPLGLEDLRTIGQKMEVNCHVPPRNDEQLKKIHEIVNLLQNGKNHVFQATTGFGKTYCAINVLCKIGVTTVIVVTKEDLMEQWRKALLKYTNLYEHEIGKVQADMCDYEGKKVVLAMVHSVAKDKYPLALRRAFGLAIFDECHRMAAETFSEACKMFDAKLRLGLSAGTQGANGPLRGDGKDFVFEAHIGPILVKTAMNKMPPKILFQATGWKLPVVRQRAFTDEKGWHWWTGPLMHSPGKMMGVYKAMAGDHKRNVLILDFLYAAWKKGRKVIAFSDLKEHLETLMMMCKAKGIPAAEMSYYVGGMSESAREEAKKAKILFATYGMTAEATDIPTLDTAVFCTPRASVQQPVGRILREAEGKKEPVVYDLVDECSKILVNFMSKRRQTYYELGAKILTL